MAGAAPALRLRVLLACVLEGRLILAQRFNAGSLGGRDLSVPEGRLNDWGDASIVPLGLTGIGSLFPSVETLGYYQISLREEMCVRLSVETLGYYQVSLREEMWVERDVPHLPCSFFPGLSLFYGCGQIARRF